MTSARRDRKDAGAGVPPAPRPPSSAVSAGAWAVSLLGDHDLHLFNEGTHRRLHEHLGAHVAETSRGWGTAFSVWAPDARVVSIIGDFNSWRAGAEQLRPRGSSGIWEGWVPGVGAGDRYKFAVEARDGRVLEKADPFAARAELSPLTASVVWRQTHQWSDEAWLAARPERQALDAPTTVYEMHLGSWRHTEEGGARRPLTYLELAQQLPQYLSDLRFTHVELLPVMEHPFGGSWGYQVTGFFAPTSRFGTPDDFMTLIDSLHAAGIGVILDWVPSHFATDEHGLALFDGTHLYEHADPRQGFHPDWGSLIFNLGRNEVRSFLLSSASCWIDRFHADGLRVDAVASMLYLDYSRKAGEWIPNRYGGRENLESISFLRALNEGLYAAHPGVQTIAEESTAWPSVSRPIYVGGLGFGMKWDMGWMHDTLQYFARDPIHRRFHHNQLTFRALYGFTENFCLPLSHDEVVHGKGSLVGKMPGDDWQRLANLRLLLGYQYVTPGKKLLFMGAELAQWKEWNHDAELDWGLLALKPHAGIQAWLRQLNRLHREEPALHELDTDPAGFDWIDANDADASVLTFLRRGRSPGELIAVCLNFTPIVRTSYRLGLPAGGRWSELANSDGRDYGGSGVGNLGAVEAVATPMHGRPWSAEITLPPLGLVMLKAPASA